MGHYISRVMRTWEGCFIVKVEHIPAGLNAKMNSRTEKGKSTPL